ncbi:MAG: hypothetical protein AB7P00_28940 [Sandaracinaceae bacterium]
MATARHAATAEERQRLLDMGVEITAEEWHARPAPARRRVREYPTTSELDRRILRELVRRLVRTFPPGWSENG